MDPYSVCDLRQSERLCEAIANDLVCFAEPGRKSRRAGILAAEQISEELHHQSVDDNLRKVVGRAEFTIKLLGCPLNKAPLHAEVKLMRGGVRRHCLQLFCRKFDIQDFGALRAVPTGMRKT